MSWEAGVDLVACTQAGLSMPNVIVHVARMVHTPAGSAPAGMILFQPDPAAAPKVMGFISPDAKVGAYFGPKIFAGTPFEAAPTLTAQIDVETGAGFAGATVRVNGLTFRTRLSGVGTQGLIHRAPGGMTPFWQQGTEAGAAKAQLWVNEAEAQLILPLQGIAGGPAAVFSACGVYAR